MQRAVVVCFMVAGFTAMCAWAQGRVDPRIAGEWVTRIPGSPIPTVLRIDASGQCALDDDAGTCESQGSVLTFRSRESGVNRYNYRLNGDQLIVSGGDLDEQLVFRRTAGAGGNTAPRTPSQPAPNALPAPDPPPARSAPVAAAAPPATMGGRFQHPQWGVSFAVPQAWKVNDRKVALLLGSDTEAGLMIVRFVRKTNEAQLIRDYQDGIEEEGLKLSPVSAAQPFSAGRYRGQAGELSGASPQGMLRARIVAVVSPFGDAAVFMGLTTEPQYAALKSRVDAMAATVAFVEPKLPPLNQLLAGQYYWIYTSTSGSTYSREDKIALCPDGSFSRGGEMYGGRAGEYMVGSHRNNAGGWTADGDEREGMITLRYPDGRSESLRYEVAGQDMVFNGKKYGRYGAVGSCR